MTLILTGLTHGDEVLKKVMYVTHEPGKWHDYTPQKEAFIALAEKENWDLTVITGTQKEVEAKLAETENFAEGQDVVIYNICMAHCQNMDVPYNIIQQTEKHKVPALLVHCTLHSFWETYKGGKKKDQYIHPGEEAPKQVKTNKELIKKWKAANPDKAFPLWSNFTGIASVKHGPKEHITVKKIKGDHPLLEKLSEYVTPKHAELYNNFITDKEAEGTIPLLKGIQLKEEAVVLWEKMNGGAKAMSFTLGHGTEEWSQEEFLSVLTHCINYLSDSTEG